MVESGDGRPTELLQSGVRQSCQDLAKRLADWGDLNNNELARANTLLQKSSLQPLPVQSQIPHAPECD